MTRVIDKLTLYCDRRDYMRYLRLLAWCWVVDPKLPPAFQPDVVGLSRAIAGDSQ